MPDIVLTGLPRSGTTLSCYLLHQLPDCVALHEPIKPRAELGDAPTPAAAAQRVRDIFARIRQTILQEQQVATKTHQGQAPQNPFGARHDGRDTRRSVLARGKLSIEKPLTPDFHLIIKHPALFAALLPQLSPHAPCFALIRNPLAAMTSWSSIDVPLQRGRLPAGEAIDPELQQRVTEQEDVIDRQLIILDWFCRRLRQNIPPAHIIRYEDLVTSQGAALAVIHPAAAGLNADLENRNLNPLYDRDAMRQRGLRLLADGNNACWHFYPRAAVIDLLDQVR